MTFILPSFGASAISAVPASGGGSGGWSGNSYALSLDGTDDYVDVGNSSDLAPSSITISAWIKVTGSVDTFNYIVSRAGSTYGSYHLRYTNANKFNVHLGFASSQFKNDITSSSTYTLTDWHHVAFTYDQTNVKLYVDGVEEYSGAETRAIDYTAGSYGTDTHIGKSGGTLGYASPSEGLIDEVAIFNSALSASDITAIYNSGTPDDLSSYSPVGWWRMGDNNSGSGTTITDQGSGGNDGTLTNGPTFSTDVPVAPPFNTYSVNFDGTNDYVSTELSVAGESELTVSAWVKLDTVSATKGFVAQYNVGGDRAFRLAHFPSLSSMWFEVYGSNSYAGYKDTSITTGTWYHVAGVFSQSSCVCYVNGVASTTTTGLHTSNTGNVATCTDNIDIGRMGNADYMDGNIDEVGIWTSALSASDITAIYNSGVPADISSYSPVLYYRMGDNDGGTGTTITDQGSGGNDGTLNNGPTFSTTVPS